MELRLIHKLYDMRNNYQKTINQTKDQLLVEQYQIPTMIYEEAQETHLYHRYIKIHKKLPELQKIMGKFFEIKRTRLQNTKLDWQTRKKDSSTSSSMPHCKSKMKQMTGDKGILEEKIKKTKKQR